MSDSYQHLDNNTLNDLLTRHRRNLMVLEKQATSFGNLPPLYIINSIENEQQRITALRATLQQRGIISAEPIPLPTSQNDSHPQPQPQIDNTPPPDPAVPLAAHQDSPFVVGRPLRPDEPIFGREDTFRFIADWLARFSPVNLAGERRMGKTSVLNHLLAHQDKYLIAQSGQPPLVLARIDLQRNITNSNRFYGVALRELLANLPPSRSKEAQQLSQLHTRLDTQPEATYDEFDRTLRQLRDQRGICVRPVLIIDEFEKLLSDETGRDFPYPHFFDGLRALMTADLIALVVASRRLLNEYFMDPKRPQSLTSTFPTYFQLHTLPLLDDTATDALLTQPGKYPLSITEVAEARRWASGHPCHLQVAGQAYYEAKAGGKGLPQMYRRRKDMKNSNCNTGHAQQQGWLKRVIQTLTQGGGFISVIIQYIGELAKHLGEIIDNTATKIIGAVLIIMIILLLSGVVTVYDVWNWLQSQIGIGQGG
ncbi:MAG: hypothetical protein GFH27_549279n332 [Chloroflexi bacterium AL-W]|nr:hypothetical protein [Chloroflexi bacterium AL-N1]NOK65298.1 hypothetical protein [Chloroflexi bacterium AL-N10]NOK72437.1 hypothetical protein [Chloroflexi bacterium AL-N5]NOK79477.1 hypothetical protein [Chloroflexi bacterium AL-W]NOK87393.1 hypothetical protein [Chloroflexi bacterium AL-N15]